MAAIGRQNQLEYFLQGSVGKDSVKALLERLKGLCDGASRQFATFQDHEIVYTLGNNILYFQGSVSCIFWRVHWSNLRVASIYICFLFTEALASIFASQRPNTIFIRWFSLKRSSLILEIQRCHPLQNSVTSTVPESWTLPTPSKRPILTLVPPLAFPS